MRIALVTPTYWPEVRRGTERVVHDLGSTLAGRGHEVTLLTTHPGATRTATEDGVRVMRARRLPQPSGFAAHEYHLTSIPSAFRALAGGAWDVAHTFFPASAWAALRARRRAGPPVVASTHGIPTREYLVARRYRLEMHLEIARAADEVSVLSAAAAEPYRRYLLRDPVILPGGVLPGAFAVSADRAADPTLFCASSLGDPRKRADLLFGGLRPSAPGTSRCPPADRVHPGSVHERGPTRPAGRGELDRRQCARRARARLCGVLGHGEPGRRRGVRPDPGRIALRRNSGGRRRFGRGARDRDGCRRPAVSPRRRAATSPGRSPRPSTSPPTRGPVPPSTRRPRRFVGIAWWSATNRSTSA